MILVVLETEYSMGKIMKIIIFSMMYVFFSGYTFAASFDCSLASSKIEKQICNNPELSKLDETLGKIYKKISKYPDVRQSQRNWIRNVRNVEKYDAVIIAAYKKRISVLESILSKKEVNGGNVVSSTYSTTLKNIIKNFTTSIWIYPVFLVFAIVVYTFLKNIFRGFKKIILFLFVLAGVFWIFDSLKSYSPAIFGLIAFSIVIKLMYEKNKKRKKYQKDQIIICRLIDELQLSGVNFDNETLDEKRAYFQTIFKSGDDMEIISKVGVELLNVVILNFVLEYYEVLKRDYRRHVRTNAYGIKDEKRWLKLIESIVKCKLYKYYIEKVGSYQVDFPEYDFNQLAMRSPNEEQIQSIVGLFSLYFQVQFEYRNDDSAVDTVINFDNIDNGHDYEHAVAAQINSAAENWRAEVTQGSGDQGVDVLAEHENGTTVAIQCKLYSQPVGNKAVQEIIAGRIHYNTVHAFVVTNNKYTKSAIELATSGDVSLLHHSDLIQELRSIVV
ncbi:MAG: restriction endonuclease [Aeromonas veronii]